jgi:hypothetical protein
MPPSLAPANLPLRSLSYSHRPLQLRVAQVTNGAASKLGKIRLVRKNVARVLTTINQKAREAMSKDVKGLKRVPKQLREKKTRAIRRALSPEQVRQQETREQSKRARGGLFAVPPAFPSSHSHSFPLIPSPVPFPLQAANQTLKATKKATNFGVRKFAVRAA